MITVNLKRYSFISVLISVVILIGCSSGESPEKSNWERINRQDLSEREEKLFERAERARRDLGSTLLSRVSEVMKKKGPAEAIEVCNLEAQGLTRKIGEKHGVDIGRTSFRLRNPENKPPEWAKKFDLVENRVDGQAILKNRKQSKLAVFSPIRLAEKCTACHGKKDQLAPGVKEELARRYPRDKATGFRPGDLRGWFWVEAKNQNS